MSSNDDDDIGLKKVNGDDTTQVPPTRKRKLGVGRQRTAKKKSSSSKSKVATATTQKKRKAKVVKTDHNDDDTERQEHTEPDQPTSSQSTTHDDNDNDDDVSKETKKLRRAVITAEEIEAERGIPSYARMTAGGGYAATAAHRKKIALANAGNVPWNKGKQRSQADKDKIKAAVQARNRRQLLANLASVHMTEDEYEEVKKKIKYARESLRKAKVTARRKTEIQAAMEKHALKEKNDKEKKDQTIKAESEDVSNKAVSTGTRDQGVHNNAEQQNDALASHVATSLCEGGKEASKDATGNENNTLEGGGEYSQNQPLQDSTGIAAVGVNATSLDNNSGTTNKATAQSNEPGGTHGASTASIDEMTPQAQQPSSSTSAIHERGYDIEMVPEIFRRDFEWTPHPVFGTSTAAATPTDPKADEALSCRFGTGGPGGLVCCDACTALYADYLSMTYEELQIQKTAKVANELETIAKYMQLNHERLTQSVEAAKRHPPPCTLGET